MLAQTFLTAKKLKINPVMYDALVKVYWLLVDEKIPAHLFYMGTVGSPKIACDGRTCGTAGCLLGWALAVDKSCATGPNSDSPGLESLFYPYREALTCDDRAKGAQALHNYLTTGKADWRSVMRG